MGMTGLPADASCLLAGSYDNPHAGISAFPQDFKIARETAMKS